VRSDLRGAGVLAGCSAVVPDSEPQFERPKERPDQCTCLVILNGSMTAANCGTVKQAVPAQLQPALTSDVGFKPAESAGSRRTDR
jgi:hypothetical protein